MGRGHSNLCEAAFNYLPRFCAKSLAQHRLSYIIVTNWGLMSCVDKSDITPYVSLFTRCDWLFLMTWQIFEKQRLNIEETSRRLMEVKK